MALNSRQIRLNIKKFRLTVLEVGKKNGAYAGLKGKKNPTYISRRRKLRSTVLNKPYGLFAIFKIFQQSCINCFTDLPVRGSNLLTNISWPLRKQKDVYK